jgi:hypothetical protein
MNRYLITLNNCTNFLCTLLIALSVGTPTNAMDETSEPLHTTPPPAPLASHTCWQTGLDSLPDWYHPCFGPAITNIKYFDLDPYWVNSRSPVFQEIYTELEPLCSLTPGGICHPGRIPRELRKLCIVSRTVDGREQRYNPFSNWCDNVGMAMCCTVVPAGLAMIYGSGGAIIPIEVGLYLTIIGGSWCCVGCCSTAVKCGLSKIHYDPPRRGLLGYIRSTPE